MEKRLKEKLATLDPKIRRQIENLFVNMNDSISILYDLATHDGKTGLYNNTFLQEALKREIEQAKRGQQKLSMIMTDIDFFKKINDTYGHVQADVLLERLAKIIQKQIRLSDIAARFGGEEFLILLPETNMTKAKKLASRLKEAVHKDKLLKKHNLTVSGGISEFKEKDTIKKFKEKADKALYQAKQTGRDKFVAL